MRKVRIDFCDFCSNYSKTQNYIVKLLRQRFEVDICDQPDVLFYGPYGHEHRLHSGVRVFVCGEPLLPDFRSCDYAITCMHNDHPSHFYLPQYYHYYDPNKLVGGNEDWTSIMAQKDRFCAFIVSNVSRKNQHRIKFFERLSQYRKVDSAGKALNNMGAHIPHGSQNKVAFLARYKFNIAYENNALPGYVTEKLLEPMLARCLPVYWGAPDVGEHFNPAAFLNASDFASEDALIERIIELDQDDAQYLEMLRQPAFLDNRPNRHYNPQSFLDFCEQMFDTTITPVARRRRRLFTFGRWILVKRHHWHPISNE